MVVAGRCDRRRGRPRLGVGVPDFRGQHTARDDFLVAGRLAANGEHFPVGEHRQGVVDARVVHRRDLLPFGRRGGEIDDRGVGRGGGGARDARRTTAVEDLSRLVHHRGAVGDPTHPTGRRPRLIRDVELVGNVLGGADREHVPIGYEVGERVLLLVDLRCGDFREQRPGVGRRVVNLRRVRPGGGVGGVAADRHVFPVGQLGQGRVPPRIVHVGDPSPGSRRGVEDRGVDDPGVSGTEAAVAADGHHLTVGELRHAGAEDAVGRGGRDEFLGAGVPRVGGLGLLPPVERQDVAGREQEQVHRHERPAHHRRPFAFGAHARRHRVRRRRREPDADGVGRGHRERVGGAVLESGDGRAARRGGARDRRGRLGRGTDIGRDRVASDGAVGARRRSPGDGGGGVARRGADGGGRRGCSRFTRFASLEDHRRGQPRGHGAGAEGGVGRRAGGNDGVLRKELDVAVRRHVGPRDVPGGAGERVAEAGVQVETDRELVRTRRRLRRPRQDRFGRIGSPGVEDRLIQDARARGARHPGVFERHDPHVGFARWRDLDRRLGSPSGGDGRRPDAHFGVVGGPDVQQLRVDVACRVGHARRGGRCFAPHPDLDHEAVAHGYGRPRRDAQAGNGAGVPGGGLHERRRRRFSAGGGGTRSGPEHRDRARRHPPPQSPDLRGHSTPAVEIRTVGIRAAQ